jgi:hypothetical protein
MKSTFAVLAAAATLSQVSATFHGGFHNAPPFSCPGNQDNVCEDKQHGGYDWSDLTPGHFEDYDGFKWNGWTCEDSFSRRDLLAPRTFGGKVISGSCGPEPSTAPSFECGPQREGKNFSVKKFDVTVEFDCRLEFHYDMPDGSVCRHQQDCRSGGTTVHNTQCGGAKKVSFVLPPQPNLPKPNCHIGVHHIDFDCDDNTPPRPPYQPPTPPAPPATTPPAPPATTSEELPIETTSEELPVETTSQPAEEIPTTSEEIKTTETSEAPVTTSSPAEETTPVSSEEIKTTETSEAPVTTSSPAEETPITTETSEAPVTTSSPADETTPVSSEEIKTTETSEAPVTTSSPAEETPVTTSPVEETPVTTSPAEETPVTTAPVETTVETTVITTTYDTISTIYTTSVQTVTSCGPEVPNCPGGGVVTHTIPVTVTTCPVTETITTGPTQTATVPTPGDDEDEELPCDEVVPKCLNTFFHLVESCKDNTDSECYCPNQDFITEVYKCVYAHGATDDIIGESIHFLQGVCAPAIPSNPGIVTGADSVTEHITITGTITATSVAYTTVHVDATVTEPCVSDGTTIPGSSTVVTISTEVIVPEVTLPTATATATATEGGELPGNAPAPTTFFTQPPAGTGGVTVPTSSIFPPPSAGNSVRASLGLGMIVMVAAAALL